MLIPTSIVKKPGGHSEGTYQEGRDRALLPKTQIIEIEDFSSGERSTEDMKYKPPNRCDRENKKSCKQEGREGPSLNSTHVRTSA